MSIRDLRGYLELLKDAGELQRITAEVDPNLEIAAITDRVSKMENGGPALLFENVRGSEFSVSTNLFGSRKRVSWALWCDDLDRLARRVASEYDSGTGSDAVERLRQLVEQPAWLPRLEAKAPWQEHTMTAPDLSKLPALKSWSGDGGAALTLPLVFTRDPASGRGNCGMYRVQVFDANTAALHWDRHADGARHYGANRARGKRMPVAIALGGDTALIYAAGAPLPGGIDEVAFAGYLRQEALSMVRCRTCDLEVPAAAEFVIEGYVDPGEERTEGPFGNHTGFYAAATAAPIFHLTSISHRQGAVFPATVVGPPPMEDCYLAKASERLFLPLLRHEIREIVDINRPLEGIFHGATLVSIRNESDGDAERVMRQLWKMGPLGAGRLVVVVDGEIDVQDPGQVYWRALNAADPQRDFLMSEGRLGIDATRKAGQGREPIVADEETLALIGRRWREYGLAG
jgi:4-hydroxy-3-polyprenylbenzoate decarboxylase